MQYLRDTLVTDPARVKKLRKFFRACAEQRGVKNPFVVGVELYRDRMHGPGDMHRFYGCFGVRPGNRLQYELLGATWLQARERRKQPVQPRPNGRRIQFLNRPGVDHVLIHIVCQTEEAYKFRQTELGMLEASENDALLKHFRALMT